MGEEYVAPVSDTEVIIASVWGQELRRDKVSVTQSFFEMEGDSMIMTQIGRRLADLLGVEITVRTIFESPTVRELAKRIESLRAVPLVPVGSSVGRAHGVRNPTRSS